MIEKMKANENKDEEDEIKQKENNAKTILSKKPKTIPIPIQVVQKPTCKSCGSLMLKKLHFYCPNKCKK